MKKGSYITPKIVSMLETINCLLLTVDKLLLPNLGMGMRERREERLCNLQ